MPELDGAAPGPGVAGQARDALPPSALIRELVDALPGDSISLAELVDVFGERAFGLLLIVLVLPTIPPTPVVPVGVTLGSVVMLLAVQVAAGRRRLWLPGSLARRRIGRRLLAGLLERGQPILRAMERPLRPRLGWLAEPWAYRAIGLSAMLMGFLIVLPIPLGNILPGLGVLAIGLGLFARDGLAILLGLALSTLSLAAYAFLAALGIRLLGGLAG